MMHTYTFSAGEKKNLLNPVLEKKTSKSTSWKKNIPLDEIKYIVIITRKYSRKPIIRLVVDWVKPESLRKLLWILYIHQLKISISFLLLRFFVLFVNMEPQRIFFLPSSKPETTTRNAVSTCKSWVPSNLHIQKHASIVRTFLCKTLDLYRSQLLIDYNS